MGGAVEGVVGGTVGGVVGKAGVGVGSVGLPREVYLRGREIVNDCVRGSDFFCV